MESVTFINESGNKFSDISTEKWRTYIFPAGEEVTIDDCQKLFVSKNGHRVFDSKGISHYIPMGWIHLKWESKKGKTHFIKF